MHLFEYQQTKRYFAQLAEGFEEPAAAELTTLGATHIDPGFRGLHFSADSAALYRINYQSRLVTRVLAPLVSFRCRDREDLYRAGNGVDWAAFFDVDRTFAVMANVSGHPNLTHSKFAALCLKDAVADAFRKRLGRRPNVDRENPDIWLNVYIENQRAIISIDTSGGSLHRRGYRRESVEAPLQETLAAAVMALSGWQGEKPLYDPMCGSGTIALEAALLATGTAPLLFRAKGGFGFEHLRDFNAPLWESLRAEARAERHPPTAKIFLSDLDPDFVDLARRIAACAGLEKVMTAEVKDFFRTTKPADRGLLIMNVPYGLRLGACRGIPTEQPRGEKKPEMRRFEGEYRESSTEKQRNGRLFTARGATEIFPDRLLGASEVGPDFLAALGDHLKAAFSGWRCGILVPASAPLKAVGLKPNLQAAFQNGLIPVKLLVYDIY